MSKKKKKIKGVKAPKAIKQHPYADLIKAQAYWASIAAPVKQSSN